jgi:predicted enzyme related to lactoylglutathione lyase
MSMYLPNDAVGPTGGELAEFIDVPSMGSEGESEVEARPTGQPVVHFEIVGERPEALRQYFHDLFGWEYDVGTPVAEEVSDPDQYGFVDLIRTPDGTGIRGGVCGGPGRTPRAMFYVGVDDVEAALADAERLGGRRVMGPTTSPSGLVVGHFEDLEGNVVGVAGQR